MKRIALILVFAVMLGLCACGQEEIPANTTEGETASATSNLEPVLLNVVRADWVELVYDSGYEPPTPKDIGTKSVDKGKTIHYDAAGGDVTIAVENFDTNGVTVRFQTNGMSIRNLDGTINGHDCLTVIPYNEAYEILSLRDDAGTKLSFTFIKNESP